MPTGFRRATASTAAAVRGARVVPLEMLFENLLVALHVVRLGDNVPHELPDELLGPVVDFVHEELAAHFHSFERGVFQGMTLIAPNKPLVRRSLE